MSPRPVLLVPFPPLLRLPTTRWALETPRLRLRPPGAADGPGLNAAIAASLPELQRWMTWCPTMPTVDDSTRNCADAGARALAATDLPLVVLDRNDGQVLGRFGLHPRDPQRGSFEIGYWLRSDRTGQGLATEAVRAMTWLATHTLGSQRVEIRCDRRNLRSQRVAERAGFILEDCIIADGHDGDGQPRDTLLYVAGSSDDVAAVLRIPG